MANYDISYFANFEDMTNPFYNTIGKNLEMQKQLASRKYIEPMLAAEMEQKQLANQSTQLANQYNQQTMDDRVALAAAMLEQQNIANDQALFNYQIAPEQWEYNKQYLSAQAAALREQTAMSQFQRNNPATMAKNKYQFLGMANSGLIPGFAPNRGESVEVRSIPGGKGGGQSFYGPTGQYGESTSLVQLPSVPGQASQPYNEIPPLEGSQNQALQQAVTQQFGNNKSSPFRQQPIYPEFGNSLYNEMIYEDSKGLQERNKAIIERNKVDEAEFNKLKKGAASVTDSSIRANTLLDEFKHSYDESSWLDRLYPRRVSSKWMGIDNPALTAESISKELTAIYADLIQKGGEIRNANFDLAEAFKLNVDMPPQTMKTRYSQAKSAVDRAEEYYPFINKLRNIGPGVKEKDILPVWFQFQKDFPLTGDYKKDRESLKVLDFYLDPNVINDIANGNYKTINLSNPKSIPPAMLEYFSPEMLDDILNRSKGSK